VSNEPRDVHVLNLGAGVQSTTLYLMFMRGLVTPPIEVAIFADTQDEPEAVYRHLDWLESLGGPRILRVTVGRLGDDLMRGRNNTGQRFASIPAFSTPDGGVTVGLSKRQCSKEYKTEPIHQAIRYQVLGLGPRRPVPRGVTVHQYFGISIDEGGRSKRIRAMYEKKHRRHVPHFPLMDRFMTRADCLTWLTTHGQVPHPVQRSACVFCPYRDDASWETVKANPADWQRAVEIDRALRVPGNLVNRNMEQVLYLHRSCIPLEDVTLRPYHDGQMLMPFYQECEGVCGN